MSTRILDIPDDPADLPGWLENELMGGDITQLARELCVLHVREFRIADQKTLEQWLGSDSPVVLNRGLAALDDQKLRQLLGRPDLLIRLQEMLLLEGGAYWDRLLELSSEAKSSTAAVQDRLSAEITPRFSAQLAGQSVNNPRRPWVWIAALATSLILVATAFVASRRESQPTWGWNEPGLLAHHESGPEYLESLAAGAKAWFDRRPEAVEAIATRIRQMRQGCDRLIDAPHSQLSEKDRRWLLERCRAWRDQFDDQLSALESGESPIEVRGRMDALVDRLTTTLRSRAKEIDL